MNLRTHTAFIIFVLAALSVLIVLNGCGPKCKSGHYITVHVPETSTPNYAMGQALNQPAYAYIMPIVTPAHDEDQFVCDVYESSK